MNWRSPRIISVILILMPLAFYGFFRVFWKGFGLVLNRHALRAESPYFLPACVACAAAPLVFGVFYVGYQALYGRVRRKAGRGMEDAQSRRETDHER